MNRTVVDNLALMGFAAVALLSLWSAFDNRVHQWMANALLALTFVAFAFTQESLTLRWVCFGVAGVGVVAATVRFRRDRRAVSATAPVSAAAIDGAG